jgi:predicted ribosome quality control (RQC) complex YloA/Tae2 family protein
LLLLHKQFITCSFLTLISVDIQNKRTNFIVQVTLEIKIGGYLLPKKDFSSVDIAVTVQELKDTIANSRVNKIYQYDKKTILLKLHKKDNPQIRLVMEAGKRIHLTSYIIKPPQLPPGFCMALRKHLSGAWLEKIEQYEFERIVIIHLRKKIGNWKLILELFGEGNIILTDGKDRILQALIFKKMRDRNIIRNEIYQFPPSTSKNPFKIKKEELKQGIIEYGSIEVVRAIVRLLGIGGVYSEELLSRAKIDKNKLCNNLSDVELEAIFTSLQEILITIENLEIHPSLVFDENNKILDVTPLKLKRYENFNFKSLKTFNEAMDRFYLRDVAQKKAAAGEKADKYTKKIERLQRIIAAQKQVIEEQKKQINQNKILGDTIYTHSSELQVLLDNFTINHRVGKDWATLFKKILDEKKDGKTPAKLVESFDSKNLLANINIDGLKFSLNLRKTIFENAAKYYDKSKKAKQKSKGAFLALQASLKKREESKKVLQQSKDVNEAKPDKILVQLEKNKIKSKKWYEKFRWFRTSDGFLVVAGKDSVSNEVLVKKYTEPNDPIFHADITGAPFVVLKIKEKNPSETSLSEASEFAAAQSRAWREGAGTADVYWVKLDQLSKSGPSGEYVPKGGFVVYGKRNWIRNVPLRLAIGLIEDNIDLTFIGGPLSAVKAFTKFYVIIIPGDLKGKELLKNAMHSLIVKLPKKIREKASRTSIEQIREFVPYTKGRITKD